MSNRRKKALARQRIHVKLAKLAVENLEAVAEKARKKATHLHYKRLVLLAACLGGAAAIIGFMEISHIGLALGVEIVISKIGEYCLED